MNTHSTTTEITIHGFHLDGYQHVNNARYLEFLEQARWYHYETHFRNKVFERKGWEVLIAQINIRYRQPARMGDVLVIETKLKEIKPKSIILTQRIRLKDTKQRIASAAVTIVVFDKAQQKALRITEEVAAIIVNKELPN